MFSRAPLSSCPFRCCMSLCKLHFPCLFPSLGGHSANEPSEQRSVSLLSLLYPINISRSRLALKVTPWLSIWTAAFITFIIGIQKSIYLTSTWPYITSVHSGATMDQMGWAVAISSLGSAAANPCFGFWNQKTLSTKKPLSAGFLCCAVGNFLYGLLPVIPFHLFTPVLYFSRFLIGVGVGNTD